MSQGGCAGSIASLNLKDKQSIVDLLMDVQCGNVSCRKAATEIKKQARMIALQ